jgi:hypothetical protein
MHVRTNACVEAYHPRNLFEPRRSTQLQRVIWKVGLETESHINVVRFFGTCIPCVITAMHHLLRPGAPFYALLAFLRIRVSSHQSLSTFLLPQCLTRFRLADQSTLLSTYEIHSIGHAWLGFTNSWKLDCVTCTRR